MNRDAEADGFLKPGYTIIDASTGNTGKALALIGGYFGYEVVIYLLRACRGISKPLIPASENYLVTDRPYSYE